MSEQTDKAVSGLAADSPGNTFLAPGRLRETPDGWAAVGHPTTQSNGCEVLNYQTRTPRPGAELATMSGHVDGPLGSSISQHQGRATVQILDQASAANPALAGQLGPRAPSGIPGQPADHIAPTGAQLEQRREGAPAMNYTRTGGELQGGPA
jgi:hypothetical protein